MSNEPNSKKRTVFHSFADAFRGIWDCMKTERNMRIHLVMCVYVLFFASRLPLTRGEMACLCLSIGAVMTAELLNTSIEKLCDFAQRHSNRFIRIIKDMAAGGVLVCAIFAALVGVVVLFRPELWALLAAVFSEPAYLVLLLASLAVSWVFVFVGPEKLKEKLSGLFYGRRK